MIRNIGLMTGGAFAGMVKNVLAAQAASFDGGCGQLPRNAGEGKMAAAPSGSKL
jgi:hypothetical protein